MTLGWQNLAPERQRTRHHKDVLLEVQRVHPTVWETLVGEDRAYFVGPQENPRLVGIAWRSNDSWCYACMNEIAFEIGVGCTLLSENGKNRIVPGSTITPEKPAETGDLVPKAVQTPMATRRPHQVKRRVYRECDGWWVEIETRTHIKQKGPYRNKAEAERMG